MIRGFPWNSAGLALFHTLGSTKDLMMSDLIDRNCYQNGYFFKLSTLVMAPIDLIYVNVRVIPTLQGTVPPILDVNICFLVQVTDRGGRNFASLECFGNTLYTPGRYARQIHLNERLFHAALPAVMPLNDDGLKEIPLSLGTLSVTSSLEVGVRLRL